MKEKVMLVCSYIMMSVGIVFYMMDPVDDPHVRKMGLVFILATVYTLHTVAVSVRISNVEKQIAALRGDGRA